MRPLTKVVLVLFLVVLAVGVLFVASHDWSGGEAEPNPGPNPGTQVAVQNNAPAPPDEYNDPVAAYQRWRDRLTGRDDASQAADPVLPDPVDLASSAEDEGTIVADRLEDPVAGADPPGPVLLPDGISGEVITGPLRTRTAESDNTYVIASGDTLYEISVAKYGSAKFVQAIVDANPGIDPKRLKLGERIILPDPEKEKPAEPKPTQTKVYVVRRGDTLIGIARRIYGDAAMYPKVYEANKDVLSSLNARLYVGMRLRLPEPK